MDLAELPCPQPGRGYVLIQTRASLISAGTERMLVEFGQTSRVEKARVSRRRWRRFWTRFVPMGLCQRWRRCFGSWMSPCRWDTAMPVPC